MFKFHLLASSRGSGINFFSSGEICWHIKLQFTLLLEHHEWEINNPIYDFIRIFMICICKFHVCVLLSITYIRPCIARIHSVCRSFCQSSSWSTASVNGNSSSCQWPLDEGDWLLLCFIFWKEVFLLILEICFLVAK